MKAELKKEDLEQIRKRLVGKYAFTPVIHEENGVSMIILGRADFGTSGYTPKKNQTFENYDVARDFADELNAELELTKLEAWLIVTDTMRGGMKQMVEGSEE